MISNHKNIIVAISGATGAIYGIRLLEILRDAGAITHLIISKAATITIARETDHQIKHVKELATHYYQEKDIGAIIASGSFKSSGMIIAPCSIKTMAAVAYGLTHSLIARAADVMLKERRRLVLMTRETPLNLSHIDAMQKVTLMGGIIAPPVNAFYIKPESVDDLVTYSVGRILDLFDINIGLKNRWKGLGLKMERKVAIHA